EASRQGPRHRGRPRRVRAEPPCSRGSKHLGERSIDDLRASGKEFLRKYSLGCRVGFCLWREGAPAPVALQSAPAPPLVCDPFLLRHVLDRDASFRGKWKDAERESEQGGSTHRLGVTHETLGGEPWNLHNLVSGKE